MNTESKGKVKICPICGGWKITYLIRFNGNYCMDCKREVIPLVTPQEIR